MEIARENPAWGEARIAAKLTLKLGIRLSPKLAQTLDDLVRNHATAMVACEFAVTVTLRFQILYAFLVMEVGSRRLMHANLTATS